MRKNYDFKNGVRGKYAGKLVREVARDRIGSPRPSQVVPDKTKNPDRSGVCSDCGEPFDKCICFPNLDPN